MKPKSKETAGQHAVYVVPEGGVEAFTLAPDERIACQLRRLGMRRVDDPADSDIVLTDACLYGNSVITALAGAAEGTVLADQSGRIAGVKGAATEHLEAMRAGRAAPTGAVTGVGLAGRFDQKLRKRADPMVLRPASAAEAEAALFSAAYKGVTDFVTKHLWPAPALAVTRWCARTGISPNQVTWASAVLVALAFWLFWIGAFIPGLVVAYAMTFLDTVDGKLARVTLQSSRFGDVLDHGIDLLHPPFWWWAWAVGCTAVGMPLEDGGLTLACIIGGYVLQRVEEGLFIARFGIEMHIWRRFDSLFRQITARRNPNLVILTVATLLDAPREGLMAVAVWTVVSLMVHLLRIVQAFIAARREPLRSWLAGA